MAVIGLRGMRKTAHRGLNMRTEAAGILICRFPEDESVIEIFLEFLESDEEQVIVVDTDCYLLLDS